MYCAATVEVFELHCGWVWYLTVSNDAALSADSVLSGGLQTLHVLKAVNSPDQLAEPVWGMRGCLPCLVWCFPFPFCTSSHPSVRLAQGHLGNTFNAAKLPQSQPHREGLRETLLFSPLLSAGFTYYPCNCWPVVLVWHRGHDWERWV